MNIQKTTKSAARYFFLSSFPLNFLPFLSILFFTFLSWCDFRAQRMSFFIHMASTFGWYVFKLNKGRIFRWFIFLTGQVELSTCCNTKAKAHTMVITTNLGQWRPTERKECYRIQSIKSSVPVCFSFLLVAYLLRLSYFMRQPQSWF